MCTLCLYVHAHWHINSHTNVTWFKLAHVSPCKQHQYRFSVLRCWVDQGLEVFTGTQRAGLSWRWWMRPARATVSSVSAPREQREAKRLFGWSGLEMGWMEREGRRWRELDSTLRRRVINLQRSQSRCLSLTLKWLHFSAFKHHLASTHETKPLQRNCPDSCQL